MKRVLMVATVPSMIGQFNMSNIQLLKDLGYEVDVATDFYDESVWTSERIKQFIEDLDRIDVRRFQIDFSRNPLRIKRHFLSYKQVIRLLDRRKYTFIHTHTPISSAIIRIAAHKKKIKVMYTAHGFHFYKGSPIKNWFFFYPVEKILSRFTDILVTLNLEDYKRATNNFKAKKTVYIPGIGIDIDKFNGSEGRNKIRKEFDINDKDIMLLSVGELNNNKNHAMVIKALEGLNIYYFIVGKGILKDELLNLAKEKNVNLRLAGYRNDVVSFYQAADLYVLPSIREGLNVSLLEAMASGLPVVCGDIRGNVDLVDKGKGGLFFNPLSSSEIRSVIMKIIEDKDILKRQGEYNRRRVVCYDKKRVMKITRELYIEMGDLPRREL